MKINFKKFNLSIAENGGGTVSLDGSVPSNGYMLSIYPELEMKISSSYQDEDIFKIFVRKNEGILAQDGAHLGAWVSEDLLYLDVSIRVEDEEKAVELCKKHGQLAYFNLEKGESVYL